MTKPKNWLTEQRKVCVNHTGNKTHWQRKERKQENENRGEWQAQ